jgi:integrase/recombinase XerD
VSPLPNANAVIAAWLASQRSDHTRSAYRSDIEAYAAWCGGERIVLSTDAAMLSDYRVQRIADGSSAASVARRMSALNGFFRFAEQQGAIAEHPIAPTAPAPVESSTTPALSADERRRVLDAAATATSTSHVLVSLLLRDGLKLNEVLSLDTADVVRRAVAVRVERDGALALIGVSRASSDALRVHLRGRLDGPLLPGARTVRLSRFAADQLIKVVGHSAALRSPLTSNALRRTFVTHAHAGGAGLDEIRDRAGHDDARTTRRYLPTNP